MRLIHFVDFNKMLNVATALSATITFIEAIDVAIRVVTGIVTLVLGVFGVLHYLKKARIQKLDEQIKQQQLYDIIAENKKKHG